MRSQFNGMLVQFVKQNDKWVKTTEDSLKVKEICRRCNSQRIKKPVLLKLY